MFREIDPEPKFEEVTDMNGDPRLLALELPESYRCYLEPVALFKARYDFHLTGLSRRQLLHSYILLVRSALILS